jgi:hypothetical protein
MAIQSFAKRTQPHCRFLGGSDARVILRLDAARLWEGGHSRAHAAKSPTALALLLRPIRVKSLRTSHKQRQAAAKLPSLMSGIRRLLKAYAILWQKLYARFSEYPFDQGSRVLVSRVATHLDIGAHLDIDDRIQTGRLSQISNRTIQRSARHAILCASHMHDAVPLSHAAKSQASLAWDQIKWGIQ